MRAEPIAALLLLLSGAASAQDVGADVHFAAGRGAKFSVTARGTAPVLYDSGLSDPIPESWDVMLIQGVMPDPAVRFAAMRPGGSTVWVELQVTRFPDGRFWAKGRFQKGAGPVRLRALDAGVSRDHEVTVYSAEVFADEPAAPETGSPPPARGPQDPAAPAPPTHGRAEWNAKPPKEPYSPDPLPWRVTLHHTDGRRTTALADSLAEAGFIQNFHQNGRGWNDIAYHFLVDASGNVIEGRPLGALGAHTLNNNEGNVGIVLLGTYHAPRNDAASRAQLDAVASIGKYLVARYGIDPASLKGHRDYKKTDCPGDLAYPKLDELRRAFAGLPPLPSPSARKPARPVILPAERPDFDGQRAKSSSVAAPKATR